jgi:hypothetical protein
VGLQEKTDYFSCTKVKLQGLVVEWKCQLCESQKQVLHLDHLLARKVESLQLDVEIQKAMEVKVAMTTLKTFLSSFRVWKRMDLENTSNHL